MSQETAFALLEPMGREKGNGATWRAQDIQPFFYSARHNRQQIKWGGGRGSAGNQRGYLEHAFASWRIEKSLCAKRLKEVQEKHIRRQDTGVWNSQRADEHY